MLKGTNYYFEVTQWNEDGTCEANNLMLWAREHEELLPGTPLQFVGGIRDIKRTFLGKRKRGSFQYKGWTLLSWSEENKARVNL